MYTGGLFRYRHSFIAGAFASLGSFFGKAPSKLQQLPPALLESMPVVNTGIILLRLLAIGLMIICNLLNLRYFLKALQFSKQTLTATVLTAATNYTLSFLLGSFIYQERITLLSILGAILIVTGLWVLCTAQEDKDDQKFKRI